MDAALFDMDGVVVDSERYWVDREETEIFPATVESGESVAASEITGMNVRDVYAHLDAEYGTTVSESEFVEIYDDAAADIYGEAVALLDEFEATLADLRERDVTIALVSSSPVRWIEIVLDRFDLSFDAVVSGEHVERSKPDPAIYDLAVERVGVPADECVAVEDSGHGIAAANAAGIHTVGIERSHNDADALAKADEVVASGAELRDLLRRSSSPRR